MRAVVYEDNNGYLRRTLVKDTDGDEMAEYGVPAGPPDVERLDWEAIKREINNILVSEGLLGWMEVNKSKLGLRVATNVLARHLNMLYKEQAALEKEKKEGQS